MNLLMELHDMNKILSCNEIGAHCSMYTFIGLLESLVLTKGTGTQVE